VSVSLCLCLSPPVSEVFVGSYFVDFTEFAHWCGTHVCIYLGGHMCCMSSVHLWLVYHLSVGSFLCDAPVINAAARSFLMCLSVFCISCSSIMNPAELFLICRLSQLSCGFTSHLTQNRSFQRRFPKPVFWLSLEKTNDIRPGNGVRLFLKEKISNGGDKYEKWRKWIGRKHTRLTSKQYIHTPI